MVSQLKLYKRKALEIIFFLPKKFIFISSIHHFYSIQKMFYLDDITNANNKSHNKEWPYIPDHPYRMLIIGGSGSGKTSALLNLIKEQDIDNLIDKIYKT